ncbi:hypothetical protein MMPV_000384 [Pyropia vietnamensis]
MTPAFVGPLLPPVTLVAAAGQRRWGCGVPGRRATVGGSPSTPVAVPWSRSVRPPPLVSASAPPPSGGPAGEEEAPETPLDAAVDATADAAAAAAAAVVPSAAAVAAGEPAAPKPPAASRVVVSVGSGIQLAYCAVYAGMAAYVASAAAPALAAAASAAPPGVGVAGVAPSMLASSGSAVAAFGAVLVTQALGFGITGVGSAVGESDTLGRLNRLRYVFHAAAPAMIPVVYAVALRCGLPVWGTGGGAGGGLSASTLLAGHWAVAAVLAALTLLAAIRVELTPLRAFGVLRYVVPGEGDTPGATLVGGPGGRRRSGAAAAATKTQSPRARASSAARRVLAFPAVATVGYSGLLGVVALASGGGWSALPLVVGAVAAVAAQGGTRRGSVAFWLVGNAAELAYLGGVLCAAHLSGGFFL